VLPLDAFDELAAFFKAFMLVTEAEPAGVAAGR